MTSANPRKGATRMAEIAPDVRAALSHGEIASATLTEGLAVDQAVLLRTVFPDLPASALRAAQAIVPLGILKRMQGLGELLWHTLGETAFERARGHTSDTVRGWACFMVGAMPAQPLAQRLQTIQPLADDPHFGVREWAWMALRPHLAAQLDEAIALLTGWTHAPQDNLRRFASEALRPRGVWCAHIPALKRAPQQALPILTPLRADPARYVQDSVANWLNDAAKDQPDWVRQLCQQWQQQSAHPATAYICRRALRSQKNH